MNNSPGQSPRFQWRFFLSCLCVAIACVDPMHAVAAGGSDDLRERFRSKEALIDQRVKIGTVSPAGKAVWSRLSAEAEQSGKLLSLRAFANFLIEGQFQLVRSDYTHLESLYRSLQKPAAEWEDTIASHTARGGAVIPAEYSYNVAFSKYPSTMHVQTFQDGKHCAVKTTKLVDDIATEHAIMATDGKRLMRFSREGSRCDEPIEIPSETWKADITPLQGFYEVIRKDDPLSLYFPESFHSSYNLEGTVPQVSSQIWEARDTVNGQAAFLCGSPLEYVAYSIETGDLLAYSIGEYQLADGNIELGNSARQNSVVFSSHEHFEKVGRLPAKTTVTIGRSLTTVHLLEIDQANATNSSLVEEMIPENAYVLDRINGTRYLKHENQERESASSGVGKLLILGNLALLGIALLAFRFFGRARKRGQEPFRMGKIDSRT
ncbi:hypothetical protein FF011L_04240 [Roseimaritima multifibrata]|uniref:Uncharacterized protein n=1 Tax=Roseimaritima multifibrata TaxID=1930274 RepID=A0A517MA22_9BACT|nr:hypothetical protein [Roseimaritima multifibrata]QDS91691.1 hypothetical protein FF011L_04240 [Roseimaritima multifibrata]